MPGVRARMGHTIPGTVIVRSGLNIDGQTKDSAGVLVRGVAVRLFRTSDDRLVARTVSNLSARFSVSPYDYTGHYLVGLLAMTADSTIMPADSSYWTADRTMPTVAGVTLPTVTGI